MNEGVAGFWMGVIFTTIVALVVVFANDCDDREGYFYVQNNGHGATVNMDSLMGSKTEITDTMTLEDATKMATQLNKDIQGHANIHTSR